MVKSKLRQKLSSKEAKGIKLEAQDNVNGSALHTAKSLREEDDDSSDEDYEEDEDDDDEPDLKTDAMILIDKIMGETQELSEEDEKRLKKALKKLDEEDEADEKNNAFDDDAHVIEESPEENSQGNEEVEEVEEVDAEDEEEEEEEEQEEDENDVPLSDVELDDDADLVPFQKITVYNRTALSNALKAIKLPYEELKFSDHLSVTTDTPLVLRDVFDDLSRELAFCAQGLDAANRGRAELKTEGAPFSRPADFLAEMIKSDEVMDKLAQELLEQVATKRGSQDAQRQRELKKFGKQIQNAKLEERALDRKETMNTAKSLKRKRDKKGVVDEEFKIMVEQAAAEVGDDTREGKKDNTQWHAKHKKSPGSQSGTSGKDRFSGGVNKRSTGSRSNEDKPGPKPKRAKPSSGSAPRKATGPKPKRLGKNKRAGRF